MKSRRLWWVILAVCLLGLLSALAFIRLEPHGAGYRLSVSPENVRDRWQRLYSGYFCGGSLQQLDTLLRLLKAGKIQQARQGVAWKGFETFMAQEATRSRLAALIYQPRDLVPRALPANAQGIHHCLISAHFFAPETEGQNNQMEFDYELRPEGWALVGIK